MNEKKKLNKKISTKKNLKKLEITTTKNCIEIAIKKFTKQKKIRRKFSHIWPQFA